MLKYITKEERDYIKAEALRIGCDKITLLARKIGYRPCHVTDMLNGKRPYTKNVHNALKEIGINVDNVVGQREDIYQYSTNLKNKLSLCQKENANLKNIVKLLTKQLKIRLYKNEEEKYFTINTSKEIFSLSNHDYEKLKDVL